MSYTRFAAMIATSTVVMFVLMYLNTYSWEHVFFSETRAYMAVLMGATMAVIMLAFMLSMYTRTGFNIAIFAVAIAVFAGSLALVRSQATVGDVSYMRAMIPHHSIAIMTSSRANIEDPRVRKLADEIIEAQNREIAEMRYLIANLTGEAVPSGAEAPQSPAPQATVGTADEAVRRPTVRTMDPSPLTADEAAEVVGDGPACRFRRTLESDPILVVRQDGGTAEGVFKLNNTLVPVTAGATDVSDMTLTADGVSLQVSTAGPGSDDPAPADLTFTLDEGLTVGYRGFVQCTR